MAEMSCEECQSLLSELALGVVHGRERADTLAHVEHCPACQHELRLMGDVADRLVELTPSAEPPPGFESRVLAAFGAAGSPAVEPAPGSGGRSRLGVRTRTTWYRPASLFLAAAALAAVVGVGGWALGHHAATDRPPASAGGTPVVAELVADDQPIGQVVVAGGSYPWVSMALETKLGDQRVTCQLREQDGKTVTLGTFALADGFGYWAARVPPTASRVTGAQLLDASGRRIATATLTVAVTRTK